MNMSNSSDTQQSEHFPQAARESTTYSDAWDSFNKAADIPLIKQTSFKTPNPQTGILIGIYYIALKYE